MPKGIPRKVEDLERSLAELSLQKAEEKEVLEREIQSLRQKFENMKHSSSGSSTMFNFRDIEDVIPKFNGSDLSYSVDNWIRDVEDNSQMFNWSDLQTLVAARKSMDGLAKLWLSSEPIFKTWIELRTAIIEEFGLKVDSKTIHQLLSKKKKLTSESYQEYLLHMKELGKRAYLDDTVIIEYIIDGINDYESNKSILYGALTFPEFKKKLKIYETMKMKSKSVPEKSTVKPANRTEKACFNCGSKGHLSRDCLKKTQGPKCFNCNKFGHIAPKCTENKTSSSTPPNEPKIMLIEQVDPFHKTCKEVEIQNHKLVAMIDTGSEVNVMTQDQLLHIEDQPSSDRKITLQGLGLKQVETLGKIETNIRIDGEEFETIVHIVPDDTIPTNLIIGRELLSSAELKINADGLEIKKYGKIEEENDLLMISTSLEEETIFQGLPEDVRDIINQYHPEEVKNADVKMKIILSDETPIYQHPRRLSIPDKEEVDRQIEEWLQKNIIRPSSSDFASPIVLVKKKNGDTRICVDYRKINKKIIKDRYPLPLIEDQVDKLQGACMFTTLDLKNGFFHVRVEEGSIKYTSFVTPSGQFEFLRTPFGLCNSPAVFQRYVNYMFKDLINKGILLTYLDDLIISSKTHEEGIERLKIVLRRAQEFGLEINWKKCQFLQTKIEYLGYSIENNSVSPSKAKTYAVKNFPTPTNLKQIQNFLGLTGYFRKFIDRYSQKARPLSDLLKQNNKFVFGEEQEISFQLLKDSLVSAPVLRIYSLSNRTEVHTDASKYGSDASKHVDALSRNPITMMIQDSITERIRQAQNEDEEIRTIKELLKTTTYESYKEERGIIYKEIEGRNLIYVPRRMQNEIIRKLHENGHFSIKKTEDLIKREFWFPKIKEKIQSVIRNCVHCILAERKSGKQEGFLNPIDKEDIPLATFHVDHLGPLSTTKKGYKYILAVVDAFTKFVWLYATKTTTTQETLDKLEIQAAIFGNPQRIISDRGTAFTSSSFGEYCKERSIKHVQITTGVPRGNGQIERINRIIIPALTKLCLGNEHNWFKYICQLQVSLNNTYQRSIGKTPFEVMIGARMRTSKDIRIQEIIEEESLKMFEEEREEIRLIAKKNIAKIQEENRKSYDKRRKEAQEYQIGDLVAIKRTQFVTAGKVRPKFLGPYQVVAVQGHDRYDVTKVGVHEGPLHTSSCADNMKPWCPDGEDDVSSGPDELQDSRDVGPKGSITRSSYKKARATLETPQLPELT